MTLKVTRIDLQQWNNQVQSYDSPLSRYNPENIRRQLRGFSGTFDIYLNNGTDTIAEVFTRMGIGVSWLTACDCLGSGIFPVSVLFASISVECVLNHDMRLDNYRTSLSHKWIDLNFDNLKKANDVGLPTNLLLKNNESFTNRTRIEFVERRNKIAHGDYAGYSGISSNIQNFGTSGLPIDNSYPTKQQALEQIETAKDFIVNWANQNPDVRQP